MDSLSLVQIIDSAENISQNKRDVILVQLDSEQVLQSTTVAVLHNGLNTTIRQQLVVLHDISY
jgi:hypothetical protein